MTSMELRYFNPLKGCLNAVRFGSEKKVMENMVGC